MTPEKRNLKTLPKAHLHIHLEGAMRPDTLTELCERYGIARPTDTRGQRFDNFGGFNDVYWAACHSIRTREDLARVVLEVAEDAATQGVWWIEPAFDAVRYGPLRAGQADQLFKTQEEGWDFILSAAEAAGRATGVGVGFISAIDRSKPVEEAMERARVTAAIVANNAHRVQSAMPTYQGSYAGIIALGLHGNEEGFPPEPFADAFQTGAKETGLLSTPHAGEIAPYPGGGPASVAAAMDLLGADRILHGVLAAEDPILIERIAKADVCLDICPSSNIQLSVFPSTAAHPLPNLIRQGVTCTLNSDDPLLFGPDLVDEFELCRQDMGLSDQDLAQLAKNAFHHSGAPEALKHAGVAAVDAWLNEN